MIKVSAKVTEVNELSARIAGTNKVPGMVDEVNELPARVSVGEKARAKDVPAIYAISPSVRAEKINDRDYKIIITDRNGTHETVIYGPTDEEITAMLDRYIENPNDYFADVAITGKYDDLKDKPSINGVLLTGNKTFENLGEKTITNSELKTIVDNQFEAIFGGFLNG